MYSSSRQHRLEPSGTEEVNREKRQGRRGRFNWHLQKFGCCGMCNSIVAADPKEKSPAIQEAIIDQLAEHKLWGNIRNNPARFNERKDGD